MFRSSDCPDLQKFWVTCGIWRSDICVADTLNSLVTSSILIVVFFHRSLQDRWVSQVKSYHDQGYFKRKHILVGMAKFDQSIIASLFKLLFHWFTCFREKESKKSLQASLKKCRTSLWYLCFQMWIHIKNIVYLLYLMKFNIFLFPIPVNITKKHSFFSLGFSQLSRKREINPAPVFIL